jgi:hypothetical protein
MPDAQLFLSNTVALPPETELTGARVLLPGYLRSDGSLRDTAFVRAFEDRFDGEEPDGLAALGHDAVALLAEAARVGGPDREAIAGWLRTLGPEDAYPGVTGPIWFGPLGRRRGLEHEVGTYCPGQRVVLDESCP